MGWKKILDEKYNQDYKGHAELAEWTFSVPLPEQIGSELIANKVIEGHIQELEGQDSQILELKAWEDAGPTWTTDYYVRVIATASPLWWTAIIIGVIALLAIAGLTYMLIKTEDILEYVGEKAGGVGISLTMIAGVGLLAVVGMALWKK